MRRKIFSGIDSILLEFHNKVKDKLLVIPNENNVSHMYSCLSRIFDLTTKNLLENRYNRSTDKGCRTNLEEEETMTGRSKSEYHREDTLDVGESDDGSYSDSSFIPEDDICESKESQDTACTSKTSVQ